MADEVKVLKIDASQATKSINQLEKELADVNEQLKDVGLGTEEFKKLQTQAASLKGQLDDVARSTDAMSKGAIGWAENVAKIGAGISGGIGAAMGAMKLFGVESESVTKSIEQLQSVMAITQGLMTMKDAIEGFKNLDLVTKLNIKSMSGLKKAIIGTGIGALVVAVGMLIAHFDDLDKLVGGKLTKTLDGLKGVFSNFKDEAKALGKLVLTSLVAPIKSYIELLKGVGTVIAKVFTGEFDKIGDVVKETKDNMIQPFKDVAEDAKVVGQEFSEGFNNGVAEGEKKRKAEAAAKRKEEWEKAKKAAQDRLDIEEARIKAEVDDEKKRNKQLLEIEKKRLALQTKGTKEYYNQLKVVKDTEAALQEKKTKDSWDKQLKLDEQNYKMQLALVEKQFNDGLINKEQYEARKKELTDTYNQDYLDSLNYILETEKLTDEERLAALELFNKKKAELVQKDDNKNEGEGEEPVDKYAAINEQLQLMNDNMVLLGTNEVFGSLIVGTQDFIAKLGELDSKIKEGKVGWKDYAKVAASGFNAIGSLMSSLADQQDATTKEGFEKQKKMQIAAAVMNTLSSVIQAFAGGNSMASQLGLAAPVGWAMGAAMAAATTALGVANIAKIQSQTFGGNNNVASASASNVSSTAQASTILPPTQYSAAVQSASTESKIEDTKVYVTEEDISKTQKKVSVQESENRY